MTIYWPEGETVTIAEGINRAGERIRVVQIPNGLYIVWADGKLGPSRAQFEKRADALERFARWTS